MKAGTLDLIKSALRMDETLSSSLRARILRLLMDPAPGRDEALRGRTPDPYLSPRAAAEYIGLSKRTLARYVQSGRVQPCRLNDRVLRFRRSDLDALLVGGH